MALISGSTWRLTFVILYPVNVIASTLSSILLFNLMWCLAPNTSLVTSRVGVMCHHEWWSHSNTEELSKASRSLLWNVKKKKRKMLKGRQRSWLVYGGRETWHQRVVKLLPQLGLDCYGSTSGRKSNRSHRRVSREVLLHVYQLFKLTRLVLSGIPDWAGFWCIVTSRFCLSCFKPLLMCIPLLYFCHGSAPN